jgi:hypothetical protein
VIRTQELQPEKNWWWGAVFLVLMILVF